MEKINQTIDKIAIIGYIIKNNHLIFRSEADFKN